MGEVKKYRVLPQTVKPTPNAFVYSYMADRGISKATVNRYKLAPSKDSIKHICFPFYDENNVLQFVKIRNTQAKKGDAKEWCVKDCKPILFGMAQCEDFGTLIITEGQIDSLSVAECGYKNAVSVPTGCNGFAWLQHCYDWITKFEKLIVFGDWEKGKMSLLDKLRSSLPMKVYSVREQDYLGEKDANDILRKFGKDAIHKAVDNAQIEDIQYIQRLAEVKSVDIYTMPKIETRIREVDKAIGGIFFGQVVLLSGKRGEGKSTFMSQLIADTIDQGFPVFVYSGELPNYHFKNWLDLQIAGGEHIKTNYNQYGDKTYFIDNETSDIINKWYYDKAFIFDNSAVDDDEFEGLLKIITDSICRYGIKLVCIDNLMTALDDDASTDLYRQQSQFVKKLAKIAKQYDVAIILVAHPKKSNADFDNDTVSGSGDITNAVDVVMNYQRSNTDDCDSLLMVTKNRLTGKYILKDNAVKLVYSEKSKRIASTKYTETKKYGCFAESSASEFPEDLPFDV
jgi:twinkle protein